MSTPIAAIQDVSADVIKEAINQNKALYREKENDFNTIFTSMLDNLKETSNLQNKAESEEIKFELGQSDSISDLAIAQQKANIALNYTVAVRDKLIEAYKEIMQIQI